MSRIAVIPSTVELVRRSWEETQVVGHRGAAAYERENTLPAFEAGIAAGASAVECDVRLSLDREIAVIHDGNLRRTTPLRGAVKSVAMETMRTAGVPTLADLTEVTKDRTVLIIEIKDGDGIEPMVVEHLRREGMVDQAICFAFDPGRVARVKAANPDQFSVWLVTLAWNHAKLFDTLAGIGADALGVYFRCVTPALAQMARDRGVPLFVWTVPPGREVDRLKSLGVNFIITDYPRDVQSQLGY